MCYLWDIITSQVTFLLFSEVQKFSLCPNFFSPHLLMHLPKVCVSPSTRERSKPCFNCQVNLFRFLRTKIWNFPSVSFPLFWVNVLLLPNFFPFGNFFVSVFQGKRRVFSFDKDSFLRVLVHIFVVEDARRLRKRGLFHGENFLFSSEILREGKRNC